MSFGWRPHVLTIADQDIERIDRARLSDVEGIPIYKAAVRHSVRNAVEHLWGLMRRRKTATVHAGAATEANAGVVTAGRPTRGGLRRFILSLVALPDWERGWCVPAILRGIRTIREQRIDWLMTSCPPYSAHLVGLALKMLTRTRWAVDFRDPWMTTGSKRLYPTSRLSMRIEAFLERRVVERSDLVVFNVERLRNAYRARYSWVPATKFVYIPNGIPTPASDGPVEKYDVFTVTYTGSLYVGRSPEPVFEAVAQLVRRGRIAAESIRVKLVGQCDVIDGLATATVVRRYGLGAIVQVQPPVPFTEAFEIVKRSHLALLLAPNLPYQVPAKVYDYLGAGTRILAIAEEGGTADLLEETKSGRAFRTTEVTEIADFIDDEFKARESARPTSSSLARYDVRFITGELVGHFKRVAAEAAAQ